MFGFEKCKLLLNGELVEGNGKAIVNRNPTTEEELSTFNGSNQEQLNEAIDYAFESQKKWERLTAVDRAHYLKKISSLIRSKADNLARIIAIEQGKLLKDAKVEVDFTADYVEYVAEWARRIDGEVIQSDRRNENILLYYKPIGVVAGIVPWNYPFFVFARKMAPALLAGDSIVIKPSSETPNNAYEFSKILLEAGLPKGIVNVIYGSGREIGSNLVKNKHIDFVTFTGSIAAGQEIMRNAAQNVAKVSLELGGKAPAIVMDDADLQQSVKYIVNSRIVNTGQICNDVERVYVHEKVKEKFERLLTEQFKGVKIGDPMSTDADMGPLINSDAVDKVESMVLNAVKEGGKLLYGGTRESINGRGYFFEPTIITDTEQKSEIIQKEIFGPVIPIRSFRTLDEAIDLANDSEAGLTSSIYSKNLDVILRAANELKFGETYVNRENFEEMQGYHSGWRKSGIGGDDGKHGILEFFNTHVVYLQYDRDAGN
ncbi:MAG: aldehyde dehydrogenase [Thermoplasmatales archaeon]|nr:aldehyde dehydrogenase [Thermoplasmatales archaeon]MCW6170337.1 aldehyde dehydrogenase [Thermoplasmatales archaeon]